MRALAVAVLVVASAPASGQDRRESATPAAREAIADFARCVVRRSPAAAGSALTKDFRTRQYRAALLSLSEANRDCHRNRSAMRAGGLPFAAALAEALLESDPTPLNVRLLHAAGTQAPTYAPSDRVAMCIARSDPDNVAALLASPIASAAETAAASKLAVAKARCSPPDVSLDAGPYALRSILATASYRLLAANTQTERG